MTTLFPNTQYVPDGTNDDITAEPVDVDTGCDTPLVEYYYDDELEGAVSLGPQVFDEASSHRQLTPTGSDPTRPEPDRLPDGLLTVNGDDETDG